MDASSNNFRYNYDADQLCTSRDCKDGVDYLGEGSYGKVVKVYSPKLGVSAVKIMQMTGTRDRQEEVYNIIKNEADVLATVNHEHIVRFHGVACWAHYFAIIMDYARAGSLHEVLKNNAVPVIPWNLRLRMVSETAQALCYLHNSEVDTRTVHGDLKSCNILLNEDLRIQVADFGAATIATKTCDRTSYEAPANARVHTVVFSAPEFLKNVFAAKAKAMDMFSFGRVMYEVITRLTPFEDQLHDNITDAIINGATPSEGKIDEIRKDLIEKPNGELYAFDQLVQFMRKCSHKEPAFRPSIISVNRDILKLIKDIPAISMIQSVLIVLNQMHIRNRDSPEASRTSLKKLRL